MFALLLLRVHRVRVVVAFIELMGIDQMLLDLGPQRRVIRERLLLAIELVRGELLADRVGRECSQAIY